MEPVMKRLASALLAAVGIAAAVAPLAAEAGDGRHHGRREAYWERPGDRGHWRRGDRYWWRGRSDWSGYEGRRAGFWYAPGYGYYAVDSRWTGHRWRRGEYLPPAYRHYYVADPRFFGLRPAPRGYAWVYAGGDIVMTSRSSGLILDVLGDVY